MGERLTDDGNDDTVYRTGEEFSAFGTLQAEEYMRKGQEVKSSLERIVADIKTSGSALDQVDINIKLLEGIRLAVIPRIPIVIRHEEIERSDQTLEPTVIDRVTAKALKDDQGEIGLAMAGRVVGARDLRAEFDPFAGHELLAMVQNPTPGVRQEGGVRLTSGSVQGRDVLEFIIY